MARKFGTLISLFIALLVFQPGAVHALGFLPGDCNADGKVDTTDAVAILRSAVDFPSSLKNTAAADLAPVDLKGIVGDGKITVLDAVAALRVAVGLEVDTYSDSKDPRAPVLLPYTQFEVYTPDPIYSPSATIPFTVLLRNNTDKEMTWNFNSGCQVDLKVADSNGKVVWNSTLACLDVLTAVVLKPGEQKTWDYQWPDTNLARQPGLYTAFADLIGANYKAAVTFKIGEKGDPAPPPPPGTFSYFDLTPGTFYEFLNKKYGGTEKIQFGEPVKQNDHEYTPVTLTPDGVPDSFLRLDNAGNLWQSRDGFESIRLKLNAAVGEKWDYKPDAESVAHATLLSRDATLVTPAGTYTNLLEFTFDVGPDAGWTEFVHPKGFWVGYSRNTIAGPVDYLLSNQGGSSSGGGPGDPVPPIRNKNWLEPTYIRLKPGAQQQFSLHIVDAAGKEIKPDSITWAVEPETLGTINADGLFTAANLTDEASGVVHVKAKSGDGEVEFKAEVVVSQEAEHHFIISVGPQYAVVMPGETKQFTLYLSDQSGEIKPDSVSWKLEPSNLGSIDSNGLFTAANEPKENWGAILVEVKVGSSTLTSGAKVHVGQVAPPPMELFQYWVEPKDSHVGPGETVQFILHVLDANGKEVKPDKVEWTLESQADIGSINGNGLFTATMNKILASGMVRVNAQVGTTFLSTTAEVHLGGGDGDPGPGPNDGFFFKIEPRTVILKPGQQVQFQATLDVVGERPLPEHQLVWHVNADSDYGTVTTNGLFTASDKKGVSGPVFVQAVRADGTVIAEDYAKVSITSDDAPPPPDPGTADRAPYLESLKITPSPSASADISLMAEMKGNMPDPSWEYLRTDVKVDGETIYLYPLIHQTTNDAVPAVLRPFNESVIVHGLTSGKTYTVIAYGFNNKLVEKYTP